jgi:hypothetical protein
MKLVNFPVIGFAGKANSGKSTAANILEAYGYTKTSFAKPLKDMLRALDVEEKYITGLDKETKIDIAKGRDFIQLATKMLTTLNVNLVDLNQKNSILMGYTPKEAINLMIEIGLFEVDSSRKFQQLLGTEWGRKINVNFWTHIWNLQNNDKHKKYVVEDVRFPNEVDLINNRRGIIVKIFCENDNYTTGLTNHASEQIDLLKCKASIYNWKIDKTHFENSLLELLNYLG